LKAQASLLRVTFVLDFGVPQILVEVHGIQVQARLTEEVEAASASHPRQQHTRSRASPPSKAAPPSSTYNNEANHASDSDDGDDHVPTIDELAKSFIKTEPAEEIRELQHELATQSTYMQESVASSDDGDEASAGIGAPLALPTYLRNLLNTALDRLSITVNDIDIDMEDHFSNDTLDSSKSSQSSPSSLNFHVERIAIDSTTAKDARVEVESAPLLPDASKLGKRRMRVEKICGRLVSDVENFVSQSRFSQPSSPITSRSQASASHEITSEPAKTPVQSHSVESSQSMQQEVTSSATWQANKEALPSSIGSPIQAQTTVSREETTSPLRPMSPELAWLESSVHTVDDDRFADASSDDGVDDRSPQRSLGQSQQHLPLPNLGGSSILYDDEGLLEFAMQNDMLNSRFEDAPVNEQSSEEATWGLDGASSSRYTHISEVASDASTSNLPTVSALGRSFPVPGAVGSPSQSEHVQAPYSPTDNLAAAHERTAENSEELTNSVHQEYDSSPLPEEDMAESRFFTHDEAESMYMSAVSATQANSANPGHVPGGWDSSSGSSRDSNSDRSGSIPEDMISGSILAPLPEVDDGCETPRPGSRQSSVLPAKSERTHTSTLDASGSRKQAKQFLTIDEITLWFPMALGDKEHSDSMSKEGTDMAGMDFSPSTLGEDSIFTEMPGSFSNYAHSSHRRKTSPETSSRGRPSSESLPASRPTVQPTSVGAPSIIVNVGSVVGHMDISTGRIMGTVFARVTQALAGDASSETQPAKPEPTEAPDRPTFSLEVTVQDIAISWLEHISTESIQEGRVAEQQLDSRPSDAILRVSLSTTHITSRRNAHISRTQIRISKFALASLDKDIIFFQCSRPRSRRSVNVLSEHPQHDIELNYEQGNDDRVTIITRSVNVMLDVQRLDDALSSFGGFSGMLELSSSMNSSSAVTSPAISPARTRPRGVHFGDALPPPIQKPLPSAKSPKIDVQFGEISLVLRGKACSMQLQTTTVRIAVRQSNVRLKVSEIQLTGPYTEAAQTSAPFLGEMKGTVVNFLFAPAENDLTRLISLITPSKNPYENNDDILIETLLRQRKKGSVLRVQITEVALHLSDLEQTKTLEDLGVELARLAKVTKYLPDDDRPGLLSLVSVDQLNARVSVNEKLGDVYVILQEAAFSHVGVPALLALEVGKATVRRNDEVLVQEVVKLHPTEQLPVIMLRMVGDEMEPMVKAKFFNLCVEYRVSTVMAALGISEDGTVDDLALGLASSVATITGASSLKTLSRQSSQANSPATAVPQPLQIDLLLRDCAIGLNPRKSPSKGLFVLTEAHVAGKQAKSDYSLTVDLRKASMHAVDDTARLEQEDVSTPTTPTTSSPLHGLNRLGYVSLSSISAAKIYVNIGGDGEEKPQVVDVEFKNELFVIESCADSTQTLITILSGLQPPTPPSTAEQYRTVVPLQQMMESFTGDELVQDEEADADDFMSNADLVEDDLPTNLDFVGKLYNSQSLPTDEEMGDSLLGEDDLCALATPPTTRQRGERALLESFQEKHEVTQGEEDFDFDGEYFGESKVEPKGKARKWDSTKNQYHLSNEFKTPDAPLKVRVRDVNVIWNLYDGYDWPRTRSVISQAVDDVEARAEERRHKAQEEDEEDDFVEQDFLFNSVWIGVPVKDERGALARRINHDIDDLASETGSHATSTATRSTGATIRPRSTTKSRRRLKLERSKHKKVAFSLRGVAVDLVVFPPNTGETINSVNVRIRDLEVFDHIPSSTWRKFVTCAIDPDLRELVRPMIDLELNTVKPITDLAASELVIKVSPST
jgi:autophagy-related protein 2